MLTLIVIAKALLEVAGFAMLGQAALFILAGRRRDQNVFYQILRAVTAPIHRFTRWLMPRFIGDAHIPYIAFLFVVVAWFVVTYLKVRLLLLTPPLVP